VSRELSKIAYIKQVAAIQFHLVEVTEVDLCFNVHAEYYIVFNNPHPHLLHHKVSA
jgi:hypothetical protein